VRASKTGETSSKPLLFFQNFKESVTEYSFKIIIFFILAKFSQNKKRWPR
jgi:deoxyadenosine/deoxycytidine kinase